FGHKIFANGLERRTVCAKTTTLCFGSHVATKAHSTTPERECYRFRKRALPARNPAREAKYRAFHQASKERARLAATHHDPSSPVSLWPVNWRQPLRPRDVHERCEFGTLSAR